MSALYQVQVERIGAFAYEALEDDMMIIFSQIAPQDAADYCFIHSHDRLKAPIEAGYTLIIGQQRYPITSVGEVVNQNLAELGHITIRFDALDQAEYPGCLHVNGQRPTQILCGEQIAFFRP
ncbi:PTS glucitol/sorbitol transporter subunit IIA [Vibrio metschnikovii]|uniref:PTS glucitol/sorbitol transporter subunit IIA n=1 Tax=Vibrio metschnikovii TaxID=28172 RepID=UPI00164C1838|nr:PTS glucitol/sorbitol transporter subunit IIA [Vibrio metschnikovii]MBC5830539.1 PTS glucitol/sorbitol transporter subunit IIA [Vibrio metschnikovii]